MVSKDEDGKWKHDIARTEMKITALVDEISKKKEAHVKL
jgi:hypothetical protein